MRNNNLEGQRLRDIVVSVMKFNVLDREIKFCFHPENAEF